MQLVADGVGNNADAVGKIADGVGNTADTVGNQFLPSLVPERSYEISCTSLLKGIFLIFAASFILMY